MFKLSKKIAFPLIAVLLIGTGVGGYFLFRNFQLPKYFVDRYSELIEYCDTQESENSLKVSCKALMLNLVPSTDSPSLTSLIITNKEELKEYTITEKEDVFTWTNDILQFKKLKPVIINIQYVKKNPLVYTVQDITFEDIPETYIQEIVNRDIDEIMGMDKSSTTILNSFDFCPRPETLPDYVIKKEEYAKYWEENILPESEYKKVLFQNYEDSTISKFFICDSSLNLEYKDICDTTAIKNSRYLNSNTKRFNINKESIYSSGEIQDREMENLKNASLLYDHFYFNYGIIQELIASFNSFVDYIQTTDKLSSISLCAMLRIYDVLAINNENFVSDSEYIQSLLLASVAKPASSLCFRKFGDFEISPYGLYLKNYLNWENTSSQFRIFEKCNNLRTLTNNE